MISRIRERKKAPVKARVSKPAAIPAPAAGGWTFFSNHAHVLFCLSAQPDRRLRDVALEVGITERAVQRIIAELEEADVLTKEKEGRRNRYLINPDAPLRHPVEAHCTVGTLITAIQR